MSTLYSTAYSSSCRAARTTRSCCAYCFYADEASVRAVPNYGLMPREVSHTLIEKAAGAAEGSIGSPGGRSR